MKRKLFPIILLIVAISCCLLCSCEGATEQSLKELTKPYINQYVCTRAQLGETDLLENYREIRITFLDQETAELRIIPKEGNESITTFPYSIDEKTGELNASFGIFGVSFKESVKLSHGKFTLQTLLFSQPLILTFEVK
jgi:hypothetical protein